MGPLGPPSLFFFFFFLSLFSSFFLIVFQFFWIHAFSCNREIRNSSDGLVWIFCFFRNWFKIQNRKLEKPFGPYTDTAESADSKPTRLRRIRQKTNANLIQFRSRRRQQTSSRISKLIANWGELEKKLRILLSEIYGIEIGEDLNLNLSV